MREQDADRLELIAAARLRVAIDNRLGRPTPPSVVRLSLSTDDLGESADRAGLDRGMPRAKASPEPPPQRWPRYLAAGLPAVPLVLIIALEAWWRADALVPLLVAAGAAVAAGALPVYLLGRLLSTGIWSAASPTLLTGAWLALVPGSVGDRLGANPLGTAVVNSVVATALIAVLGVVQIAVGVPRFGTRAVGYTREPVDLRPLVRYGMAAAGFGAGAVLHTVLAGWPATPHGSDLGVLVVTTGLTALAYTVAVTGIQLATALSAQRTPRFGPAAFGTTFVLLTLWQLAVLSGSAWRIAACVVVLAAAGCLAELARRIVHR